jgi:DNA-binding beta-propeller fold protein YncE
MTSCILINPIPPINEIFLNFLELRFGGRGGHESGGFSERYGSGNRICFRFVCVNTTYNSQQPKIGFLQAILSGISVSPRVAILLFLLLVAVAFGVSLALTAGNGSVPELVWGKKGVQDGDFARPRAIAIDAKTGHLFVVDFTARVQMYDLDGHHLGLTFQTPDFRNGRPSGLSIDRDGNLLVADSHYHCVRVYDHAGTLLKTLGGEGGDKPGQFGYLSDCVQDADGYYYISEFGQNQRITKLAPDGKFVACWGEQGVGPLQFNRVRALAIGPDGLLYAADACNHRVQVLTRDGRFVRQFGEPGGQLGQLQYPYDLAFGPKGELYIAEYGNHRVQKWTAEGRALGTWGLPGRRPGELANPWALDLDPFGRVHIVDTENHRVQRLKF